MNELQLHCCECLSDLVLYYSYDFTVNIPPMDCYYFMYEVNVLFPFLTGLYACIWTGGAVELPFTSGVQLCVSDQPSGHLY